MLKGKGLGKELKVWIGELPVGLSWEALQEQMNQVGKTTWIEGFEGTGKGSGAAAYATEEEAAAGVAALNGSAFEGATLVVDAWEKPPMPD